MHSHFRHRHPRLSGFAELFDLALQALSASREGPDLPTGARLRRDIGLPEIEDLNPMLPKLPRRT